ncbi:MAG: hypothetical protein JNJ59_20935 [Deltaproteobacteria bacterium]|nr:hypothetical protein [Deltaproteobacteria bacterium]
MKLVLSSLCSLALASSLGCGKKEVLAPDSQPAIADSSPAATHDTNPPAAKPDASADTSAPADTTAPAAKSDAQATSDAPSAANDAGPAGDAAAPSAADTEEPEFPPEAWTLAAALPAPTPTPATGACVKGIAEEPAFMSPIVVDHKVELCRSADYTAATLECWTLDLDTAALAQTKPSNAMKGRFGELPAKATTPGLQITKKGKAAKACLEDAGKKKCVDLELGGLRVGQAALAGTRVFVAPAFDSAEVELQSDSAITVFDATTGKRLASIPLAPFESQCPNISWAGEVLYIEAGVCAGPGAVGFFVDPLTGKTLSLLGGGKNSASAYGVTPIALPDGRVAFREQYGHAIFFHDPKTGAHLKTLNLTATLKKQVEFEGFDNSPEEGDMALLDDGRLLVTQGAGSRDRVVLVDPVAGKIDKLITLPACP